MTPPLETSRLFLQPLELADAEQVQRLFPHWQIVRYLASRVPWPYPPDGARQFFRDVALPAVERGDEWIWTLRLKTDPDRIIGSIGLKRSDKKNRGFWLGLFLARAGADDRGGRRRHRLLISEKAGMRVIEIEERDFVSGRLPAEIWEITAEEWNARRR